MLTTHFLRSASTGWLDLATVSFARYDGVQELPSQKITILVLRFWALFSAYSTFLLVAASAGQGDKQKKAEKAKKQKKRTGNRDYPYVSSLLHDIRRRPPPDIM
jgi:hypothetical protein